MFFSSTNSLRFCCLKSVQPFPLICIDSVFCPKYTSIHSTFGYLCICVFVVLQNAMHSTQKQQMPQVFYIYTISVWFVLHALIQEMVCVCCIDAKTQ